MGDNRKSNWGVMAIVGAAIFAALAYWVLSANGAPTLPYAIAQYVLLGSVLVGMVDSLAKCRPAQRVRSDAQRVRSDAQHANPFHRRPR